MKAQEIPQDPSYLEKMTREKVYALNEKGEYVAELSRGWTVKTQALDVAWELIRERVAEARRKVDAGEYSPLYYFMELHMMDVSMLADYTGFWKWQVKRHLKPSVFKKLSHDKLNRYARVFDITLDELINMRHRES
ncbi:MAG: hypothetical protein KatS3mg031_2103 [Chitinophagales bacterium]|nr:MAG: hypothetical protein KatS3mg031_2103 [Chitinophagales bacterium]